MQRYNAQAAAPVAARTQAEVCRFLAGLELIEPGIDLRRGAEHDHERKISYARTFLS
ncbi:hypothetical protein [Trebonia sp.]|uniref:hypothetical protein n=1 Tax=Trebonia sp. TaxID=2767075 RepID=UPI003C78BE51